jgi:hypothetical protein
MAFGHEKLDVYRAAIDYVGWAFRFCEGLRGHRNAKDQLLRASQAIPLNIAEGNGKATEGDRRRHFEHEESGEYRAGRDDTDSDTDPDAEANAGFSHRG